MINEEWEMERWIRCLDDSRCDLLISVLRSWVENFLKWDPQLEMVKWETDFIPKQTEDGFAYMGIIFIVRLKPLEKKV